MNKFLKIFTILPLVAVALSACDHINEDERYIELPAVESQRVVLLEEFTGQKCVNCPDAHIIIENLLKQYPENLISVSIHSGGDAFSYDEEVVPFGLRNAEGQAYYEANNVYSLPSGIVDRVSGVQDRDQWGGLILKELEKPSHMDLALEATLNGDLSEIAIATTLSPYETMSANLQLWVVEDSIVARQLSGSQTIRDYVHNHVFRGTVNGLNGEPVSLKANIETVQNNTVTVKEHWEPENLYIVGFVYNKDGVQQAAKTKVKQP